MKNYLKTPLMWLAILFGICCAEEAESASPLVVSVARFTYYSSYPFCCPLSPNYDPSYATDECSDYSGCVYMGDFAGIGHVAFDFVRSHNLVAFYDNSDPNGQNWSKKYANHIIEIRRNFNGRYYVFNATIVDTCGNNDCGGCCAANSNKKTGYLIDMEYYTVMNIFGDINAATRKANFTIF